MKYLKVFTDFAISIAALDDAERGRLFGAMLSYAECGKEPVLLGNERFVWGIAKLQIDRERDCYDRKPGSCAKTQRAKTQGKAGAGKGRFGSAYGTDCSIRTRGRPARRDREYVLFGKRTDAPAGAPAE